MERPLLQNQLARHLFLDRHLLLRQEAGPGSGDDLDGVLERLGFVQVDSVNTLARAHDLILWSRRGQYRPRALEQAVAKRRSAFEHWTHDAAIIPMTFYPMWRLKFERDEARMRSRWSEDRRQGWEAEIRQVLQHVTDNGPTSSLDVGSDEKKGSSGWWDWHPSKTALEFLWRSGVDWAMSEALQRLGFGTSGELAAFFEIVTKDDAKEWCMRALEAGQIVEADIEMADGSRRRSFVTEPALNEAASLPEPSSRVRLLSPFDPALRDRARAERLFGFHYRIEIFVPEAKRRYGYYVFPVMQGDRMIGRLDAKRAGTAINARAFWPEAGVQMGKARTAALVSELERVRFLAGLEEIGFADDWLRSAL